MELLTVEETASMLTLSPYTIREMLNQKKLPGIKVGRQWRSGTAHVLQDDDPRARMRTLGRPLNDAV